MRGEDIGQVAHELGLWVVTVPVAIRGDDRRGIGDCPRAEHIEEHPVVATQLDDATAMVMWVAEGPSTLGRSPVLPLPRPLR